MYTGLAKQNKHSVPTSEPYFRPYRKLENYDWLFKLPQNGTFRGMVVRGGDKGVRAHSDNSAMLEILRDILF